MGDAQPASCICNPGRSGGLAWLTIAALGLMVGSFIVLAQWGGEPKNSVYVPAHIENGKLVPGTMK